MINNSSFKFSFAFDTSFADQVCVLQIYSFIHLPILVSPAPKCVEIGTSDSLDVDYCREIT